MENYEVMHHDEFDFSFRNMIERSYDVELSKLYYEILESTCPLREDFDSEEEYIEACKKFQMDLLANLREKKNNLYENAVDVYNSHLSNKHNDGDLEAKISEFFTEGKNAQIEYLLKMYNILIASSIGAGVVVCSTLPEFGGFLIPLFAFQVLLAMNRKKTLRKSLDGLVKVRILNNPTKEIDDVLYEMSWKLRSNHFSDEKEYKKLIERINSSENVIQELLDIANPDNYGFRLVEINGFHDFDLEEDEFVITSENDLDDYTFKKK